jgi:quinol monooxygenase YgiN
VSAADETITGVSLAADLHAIGPRPMVAILDAKPGQAAALRHLILELSAHVRREPGCVAFLPYEDHATTGRFYLYEIYHNLDAFKTHLRTGHVKHFAATVPALCSNDTADALVQLDELAVPADGDGNPAVR